MGGYCDSDTEGIILHTQVKYCTIFPLESTTLSLLGFLRSDQGHEDQQNADQEHQTDGYHRLLTDHEDRDRSRQV